MTARRDETVLEIDWVTAIAYDPDVYAIAKSIPDTRSRIGRPRHFPDEIYTMFDAYIGAFGSARRVAAVMGRSAYWSIILDGIRHCLGDDFAANLRQDRGPTKNHWDYNSKRIKKHTKELGDQLADQALARALAYGHFDPHARDKTTPDRVDFVVADGTVVSSPVRARRKKDTNKPGRKDPAAGWHHEGGEKSKEPVYGSKFVLVSTRPDDNRLTRLVLDVRHQPPGKGYGGEAGISVAAISALRDKAPGLRGVCYDGAFRGVHRNALMKRGLVVVSPQHGGAKPQPLDKHACKCGRTHDLWTANGAVCVRTIQIDGTAELTALPIVKHEKRKDKGTYRWYHLLRLPCERNHRVRIDMCEDDISTGFNRPEHICQPETDGYKALYGYRNDSESLNATLDRTLHERRMIAYGAERQTLIMIGFALAQNAIARWFRREAEEGPPRAA